MQPYFFPYAGYFRLCAAGDIFVVLDDVQFPRRGWVHRNKLKDTRGNLQWLTLPLEKSGRDDTRITDLRFRGDGGVSLKRQLRRFPLFSAPSVDVAALAAGVSVIDGTVADCLVGQLKASCALLGLSTRWERSGELDLDPALRGWQRLAAIAKHFGADTYINAPGGTGLYAPADFGRMGIRLRFLKTHQGPMQSVLQSLHERGTAAVRNEIHANLQFMP